MKVILSSPANNANCKSVAKGLYNSKILAKYYTSVAVFAGGLLYKLGNFKIFSEIKRKEFDIVLKPYIKTFPLFEIGRMVCNKLGISSLTNEEHGMFCINNINLRHDKRVAKSLTKAKKHGVKGVLCYEDVASITFKEAQRLRLKCFYELPIGYWRYAHKILKIEQEKWPEWADTITGFSDSRDKLMRKDDEIRLADRIFVASSFTAKTLEAFPDTLPPIEIIPYGFPPVIDASVQLEKFQKNKNSPLKLLYVGSLTQRKGIANLFEAVDDLTQDVELTIVGNKVTTHCPALDDALTNHKWIPTMAHDKILNLMQEQDIFVFPSLFEGFGLVITEAMSQGTPVITTDRTAGKEFIEHGVNGWLVDAGSTKSLREQLRSLVNDRTVIERVSKQALITAKSRPWEKYCIEIAQAVQNELNA